MMLYWLMLVAAVHGPVPPVEQHVVHEIKIVNHPDAGVPPVLQATGPGNVLFRPPHSRRMRD